MMIRPSHSPARSYFEVEALACGYSDQFRLSDIGFRVQQGAFAGIIGPNGAGKTTLFRAISGELPYRQGGIWLQGTELSGLSFRQRARQLAVVTQRLEPVDMTVSDYVLLGRMPFAPRFRLVESAADRALAQHYLQLTDLAHLAHKNLLHLSGGEQQLAAIARALCQQPRLLLLDEPTSQLDITHAMQVLNLIQRLNESLGLTVLMIIHDLNLAGEFCNYLVLLNQGRMHTQGTPAEVLTYAHIEQVYRTVVVTQNNPVSNNPLILPVSERTLRQSHEALQRPTAPDHLAQ